MSLVSLISVKSFVDCSVLGFLIEGVISFKVSLRTISGFDNLFILKRISVRYSGDAYSFQCGMQSLIWGECNIITLVRNAVENMWKFTYLYMNVHLLIEICQTVIVLPVPFGKNCFMFLCYVCLWSVYEGVYTKKKKKKKKKKKTLRKNFSAYC